VQPQTLYDIASENLRKSYDLQPEQLQNVLQVSIKSITESLTVAQLALDNSDLADLLSAVHKMKGTLLSLGLTIETRQAEELENDLHQDVEKDYQPPFDELKQNLQPLLSAEEK
jgi:HPt (histidine-containing phosphotransfer) domain-containing protein